jgi:hypothetical protein
MPGSTRSADQQDRLPGCAVVVGHFTGDVPNRERWCVMLALDSYGKLVWPSTWSELKSLNEGTRTATESFP